MIKMSFILDAIALILLASIVVVDIYKNRKNVKFFKVLVLRYSNKFVKKIEDFSEKYKIITKGFGLISFLISIPLILLICYFIFYSVLKLQSTVALVLPSVSGFKYPGPIISVPFFYWIISIFLIIFFHETMHALVAAREGLKIKSYGLIYLLLIPIGAFVDVDEKRLKKISLRSRIKIYAAGSFGNILLALIILLLIFLVNLTADLTLEEKGVYFESTTPNTDAHRVNLTGVITRIDNHTISNIMDLKKFLSNKEPGSIVTVYTTTGNYTLRLVEEGNTTMLGIQGARTYIVYKFNGDQAHTEVLIFLLYLLKLLEWIFNLSLGIGLANMLPIVPLDGGLIVRDISIHYFGKKRGTKIAKFISILFVLLIVFSLLLSLRPQIKVSLPQLF
ncbi:MAG: site-2 protease family protein [Candidatus Aenigmarchaeota archaeon]|nr:site-2 protease family protein [Candidatus Aenigmarchaeota archaeon]MDW8160279.1 site-2 protease family protein [Candidatus Aenigmarchaeota archaeon]